MNIRPINFAFAIFMLIGLAACGGGGSSASYSAPPTVTAITPDDKTADVAVDAVITATFSKAMDASSVSASFTLATDSASSVPGIVTYSDKTATFTPATRLDYSTTYIATIKTGVKDATGNELAGTYSRAFKTQVPPDTGIDNKQCVDISNGDVVACDAPGTIVVNPAQEGMGAGDANSTSGTNAAEGSEMATKSIPWNSVWNHNFYRCTYVDEVQLVLGKAAYTTGTVTVEIRNSDRSSEVVLSSSTVNVSSIPFQGGWVSFKMNKPACVISGIGKKYRIAVSTSHEPAGADAVYWYSNAYQQNSYLPGSGYEYGWQVSFHFDYSVYKWAGDDFAFRTFMSGVPDQAQWDSSGYRAAISPVAPSTYYSSGYSFQEFVPGYH